MAELYDQARPSYPRAAVDAVIEFGQLAPAMRIVDVGAGTGKATVLFAERGLGVVGLEPSADMARVARANAAPYSDVEIVETEFERWEPQERFSALISVQAWHWVEPEVRYRKADQALARGATLAAIWMVPDWQRCRLRAELSAVYSRHAPELVPNFPMHPDSEPARLTGDWPAEIADSAGFGEPVVQIYRWPQDYRGSEYAALLQTHQDHILLDPDRRSELLDRDHRRHRRRRPHVRDAVHDLRVPGPPRGRPAGALGAVHDKGAALGAVLCWGLD